MWRGRMICRNLLTISFLCLGRVLSGSVRPLPYIEDSGTGRIMNIPEAGGVTPATVLATGK